MKLVSHTTLTLFVLGIVVRLNPAAARLLGDGKEEEDQGNDMDVPAFDAAADPHIMEVTTDKGASVHFYEPIDGAIVASATFIPDDKTNPIKEFQAQSDKDTGFGAFYEWLTGEKPKGRIKAALMRHAKLKKSQKDAPTDPGDEEQGIPARFADDVPEEPPTPPDRRDPFHHRQLGPPAQGTGSMKWWCERGCNSYRDLLWGYCLFDYSLGLLRWYWGDSMFVEVYPYDGGEFFGVHTTISHIPSGSTNLVTLANEYANGLSHILVWAGAGRGWYRGYTNPGYGAEYHASYYSLAAGYSFCLDPNYPGFGCSWWGSFCPVYD